MAPRIVFVSGIPESGRKEIVEFVLRNAGKTLPEFEYVCLEDVMIKTLGIKGSEEIDLSKAFLSVSPGIAKRFEKDVEKVMLAKIRSGNPIIMSGCLTLNTKEGQFPLLSERFFRKHKPYAIIIMELEEGPGEDRLRTVQDINRNHASVISSLFGCEIKTIRVERGNYRKAIRELSEELKRILGKQLGQNPDSSN